ncbi:hypothetical protein [Thomasclavelia ramosa]|uniref:hypothetical protein n=1 Tax=Thomasclavelia ramosa TaxID=1547 RepID=UPI0034A8A052
MDTFRNGFTIERDGKVITLTSEEMSIFRYLDQVITGIENDILDNIMNDAGATEQAVINDYMESNMK